MKKFKQGFYEESLRFEESKTVLGIRDICSYIASKDKYDVQLESLERVRQDSKFIWIERDLFGRMYERGNVENQLRFQIKKGDLDRFESRYDRIEFMLERNGSEESRGDGILKEVKRLICEYSGSSNGARDGLGRS